MTGARIGQIIKERERRRQRFTDGVCNNSPTCKNPRRKLFATCQPCCDHAKFLRRKRIARVMRETAWWK